MACRNAFFSLISEFQLAIVRLLLVISNEIVKIYS